MIIFQEKYSSQDCILKCRDLDPRNWKKFGGGKTVFYQQGSAELSSAPKIWEITELGRIQKIARQILEEFLSGDSSGAGVETAIP